MPIRAPVNPFKYGCASRQSFVHLRAGKFAGAAATRLELRTHIRRREFGQPFHRNPIKSAGMFVAEEKASAIAVKNDNRFRGMLDQSAETRFAGLERGR